MRTDNVAFRKRIHESRIKTVRRSNIQITFGLLTLAMAMAILYLRYLG
jgi:hypothetical protein